MKKIFLIKELEKYQTFNIQTVSTIIKKERNYAKLVIYRMKKEGLIFKIERNKYTVHNDPLLISSSIVWPSYIAFWSALRYHNLTEQLPHKISIITTRATKNRKIKFNYAEIIFTKISPKFFFGFNKEIYNGFIIFVSDPEKTIIDSILFKKISVSEIYEILKKNFNDLNAEKIIDYALRTGSDALIKRIGYLLEKFNKDFCYKVKKVSKNYVLLDYCMPYKNRKNKKWRIIENVEL